MPTSRWVSLSNRSSKFKIGKGGIFVEMLTSEQIRRIDEETQMEGKNPTMLIYVVDASASMTEYLHSLRNLIKCAVDKGVYVIVFSTEAVEIVADESLDEQLKKYGVWAAGTNYNNALEKLLSVIERDANLRFVVKFITDGQSLDGGDWKENCAKVKHKLQDNGGTIQSLYFGNTLPDNLCQTLKLLCSTAFQPGFIQRINNQLDSAVMAMMGNALEPSHAGRETTLAGVRVGPLTDADEATLPELLTYKSSVAETLNIVAAVLAWLQRPENMPLATWSLVRDLNGFMNHHANSSFGMTGLSDELRALAAKSGADQAVNSATLCSSQLNSLLDKAKIASVHNQTTAFSVNRKHRKAQEKKDARETSTSRLVKASLGFVSKSQPMSALPIMGPLGTNPDPLLLTVASTNPAAIAYAIDGETCPNISHAELSDAPPGGAWLLIPEADTSTSTSDKDTLQTLAHALRIASSRLLDGVLTKSSPLGIANLLFELAHTHCQQPIEFGSILRVLWAYVHMLWLPNADSTLCPSPFQAFLNVNEGMVYPFGDSMQEGKLTIPQLMFCLLAPTLGNNSIHQYPKPSYVSIGSLVAIVLPVVIGMDKHSSSSSSRGAVGENEARVLENFGVPILPPKAKITPQSLQVSMETISKSLQNNVTFDFKLTVSSRSEALVWLQRCIAHSAQTPVVQGLAPELPRSLQQFRGVLMWQCDGLDESQCDAALALAVWFVWWLKYCLGKLPSHLEIANQVQNMSPLSSVVQSQDGLHEWHLQLPPGTIDTVYLQLIDRLLLKEQYNWPDVSKLVDFYKHYPLPSVRDQLWLQLNNNGTHSLSVLLRALAVFATWEEQCALWRMVQWSEMDGAVVDLSAAKFWSSTRAASFFATLVEHRPQCPPCLLPWLLLIASRVKKSDSVDIDDRPLVNVFSGLPVADLVMVLSSEFALPSVFLNPEYIHAQARNVVQFMLNLEDQWRLLSLDRQCVTMIRLLLSDPDLLQLFPSNFFRVLLDLSRPSSPNQAQLDLGSVLLVNIHKEESEQRRREFELLLNNDVYHRQNVTEPMTRRAVNWLRAVFDYKNPREDKRKRTLDCKEIEDKDVLHWLLQQHFDDRKTQAVVGKKWRPKTLQEFVRLRVWMQQQVGADGKPKNGPKFVARTKSMMLLPLLKPSELGKANVRPLTSHFIVPETMPADPPPLDPRDVLVDDESEVHC